MVDPVEEVPDSEVSDRVRMNIWIRRTMWKDVQEIAKKEDMSLTDVVKVALKDYIKRLKEGN